MWYRTSVSRYWTSVNMILNSLWYGTGLPLVRYRISGLAFILYLTYVSTVLDFCYYGTALILGRYRTSVNRYLTSVNMVLHFC